LELLALMTGDYLFFAFNISSVKLSKLSSLLPFATALTSRET